MNNERFIGLLEMKLIGMISAHRLITEFDNSSVDHYQREVDMLKNRISLLKAENEIDASDAPDVKHDAYADVRNLECEADSTDTVAHTSSAALETRIDLENLCVCTSPNFHKEPRTGNIICLKCTNLHITHLNE
ncbi:hypothetical protein [Roseivirga spongicola]|uniref:Uncharacterized protein n=1 Tax=Roseivirga spongicola TaxID=333140 RepID=A0A150XCK9_9BACT|nr:hypothetical protein [Roseivirga spongicola]KYG76404.1 hypothetical protein AWW68_19350 [Roseivirga spongicola]WPZ08722.1 hypothetical protein T7867_10680 [Roseivirga spongicola]